ncbi:MAG: nuclear transport factor 2 family protein [Rhodospirillales bacterium]|nr:nuclear transport factor 2 family protein [Rhodospirillales bacterium]
MQDDTGRADCARIHEQWHHHAKSRDVDGLLALYAEDAILESPLVPAILDDVPEGMLEGRAAIRRFVVEGTRRRPNALVRWYRSDVFLTDGRLLIWEYPRATPDGDQVDIVEVMEIAAGLIRHHRIYWGWKGCFLIAPALAARSAL